MKAEVGIAELKGRLSECLRAVRKGGEIVIENASEDRETPIARLVPYEKSRLRLETIPATMSLRELDKLQFFAPKGLTPGDLDEALREERRDRFDGLVEGYSK